MRDLDLRRFTFATYLGDRWLAVLLSVFGLGAIALVLAVMALNVPSIILVISFSASLIAVALVGDYLRKRRFWKNTQKALSQAQTVAEAVSLLEEPSFLEGSLAFDMVSHLGAMASAELFETTKAMEDHRRYVELWIHETKTPIAAATLTAQRLQGEAASALAAELETIERQVEQALFFARSTNVSNDYDIREVDLSTLCREACKRNARFLIEQGCTPVFHLPDPCPVLADKTWVIFMLGQIVVNAAQYGATEIRFTASRQNEGTPHGNTRLTLTDNGKGIPAADVPQVFNQGFTGQNGRMRGKATGMGLYLVAVMATKMGLGVFLESEEGEGTEVSLVFPHDRSMR